MPSSAITARDRFAKLLGEAVTPGPFSARRTARPDGLRLEVRGIGPIAFPVSAGQAKQLCLIGRPARFGKGEQTLLDAGVRDTWEIPKSRITIDKRQWNATLRPVLDRLRTDLSVPDGCELAAEFHSMLVYAPGQFFAPWPVVSSLWTRRWRSLGVSTNPAWPPCCSHRFRSRR